MKFSEIQLHPLLQANLDKIKFLECTPIQEQAIPLLRKGKDLSGLAQTGTGKTGAFLIPLIDRLLKGTHPDPATADSETVGFPEWKKQQFVLILVPTRELAEQVQENAKSLLDGTEFSCVSVYGGTTYEKQIAALKGGVEFVIATPGRFIDLYKEHVADLGMVRAVVFDEADRMFDMGFRDDMKFILKRIPRDRQFLVFSATLNFEVLNVAYENGADPVEINVSREKAKAENVKDSMIHLGHLDKPKYLLSLIKKHSPRQAIIFTNFKHNVERIAKFLSDNGVPAMGISSLLTQAQRNRVMEQFKAENDQNILVATDVAARGLDILGVDVVFNYDLSDDPENYVHRIGRTGRAGQLGQAFSLVSDRDVDALQRVEEFLGNKLEVTWVDDAELVQEFRPFPRDEGRHGPAHKRRDERGGPPGRGGDRDRGGRGPRRDGPPREPRREGSGPRADGPGGPPREGRPPRGEGRGPRNESHRDRNTGRHRDGAPGEADAAAGSGPRPTSARGPRRDHAPRGPRPAGGPAANGAPKDGARGNGRPDPRRPNPPGYKAKITPRGSQPAASASKAKGSGNGKTIGKKVSGFLKKLFGGKST